MSDKALDVGLDAHGVNARDDQLGHDISGTLRVVGSIAGQASLIAALLFYFGWARTQALLNYFGVSASVAHLSVNDYVLRSLSVTIRPLIILGLLMAVLLSGHRWLAVTLTTRRHPTVTHVSILACIALGLALFVAGLLGFYNWVVYSTRYPFVPVLLAIGVTLVGYGFRMHGSSHPDPRPRNWWTHIQTTALVIVDIAFIFWAVAVYASAAGQQAAEQLASNLSAQPGVVVYSINSLDIAAPGVQVERIAGKDSQYRYRYSNLRLLLYSDGRYLVLPGSWRKGDDPVFLLAEDKEVRFEFYSGS